MELFGVELVGFNAENGRKLLLTVAAIVLLWALGRMLVLLARAVLPHGRAFFWARQGARLAVAVLGLLVLISIWFDDPARLATGLGLVTAGLAFALQKVITAIAGYFVILRGQTFNVGDRISMGGVRGDVIALSFTQTTIIEMGQPPDVQDADPAMWVRSRQYTGRVVTVTTLCIVGYQPRRTSQIESLPAAAGPERTMRRAGSRGSNGTSRLFGKQLVSQ